MFDLDTKQGSDPHKQTTKLSKRMLAKCLLKLLRPLVLLALRSGMPHRAFDRLVRRAYVEVADNSEFTTADKQTVSGISLITGIRGRHRVTEIRDMDDAELFGATDSVGDHLVELVDFWCRRRAYQEPSSGMPDELKIYGPAPSFQALVKEVFPQDVTISVIVDVAINRGFITQSSNDSVRRLMTQRTLEQGETELIRGALRGIYYVNSTVVHNLNSPPVDRLYQQFYISKSIPADKSDLVKELIRQRLKQTLDALAVEISDYEDDDTKQAVETIAWGGHMFKKKEGS